MSSKRRIWSLTALVLAMSAGLLRAQDAPAHPGMVDPLGRYQLQLPEHWSIVATNSKLKGFVIGNGEDSFVALYHDGKVAPEQVRSTLAALCSCAIPDHAKLEALRGAAYPAQYIHLGGDDQSFVATGSALFPGGMFAIVSTFRHEQTRQVLMDVLRKASPGPTRPK